MIRRIVLVGAALLLTGHAIAHTKLAGSTPAAESAISQPPEELVLEFAEPVRLTVVTLVDAAGSRKRLSAVPAEVSARFVLEVGEPLMPGAYVIAWRAIGADTHVVSGEVPFRVTGAVY